MQGEIILYQTPDNQVKLEVIYEEESIWLTQAQIVTLFSSSKANISEHIKNIYLLNELDPESTVRKIRTVQVEGARKVSRSVDHYNLDMIISIGYRVNSVRGTRFRIWANKILKDYLLKGYAVSQRFDRLEQDVFKLKNKFEEFDLQIKTSLPPHEGIFYDGQIFDAHHFVSGLIKSAKKSIILIDNYIDENVLILLSKRNPNVIAKVYTSTISPQLRLDIERFNTQYPKVEVGKYSKSHDRFLVIDKKEVYHIGASMKDLGKKWFAFSKIAINAKEMIMRLEDESSVLIP
jgi:hypothetical protein